MMHGYLIFRIKDIHDEANGLYNIFRGGFYHDYIDLRNLEETSKRWEIPTLEVDKVCPFAQTFNISGTGERIVWKPASPSLSCNPQLWLKTKGLAHRVTNSEKLSTLDGTSRREEARKLADATVTENRLVQGWRYLEEMGMIRDKKERLRVFMSWAGKDVMEEEERSVLLELGLDEVEVRKYVGGVAAKWYLKKLHEV
jgi:hypothetical protein